MHQFFNMKKILMTLFVLTTLIIGGSSFVAYAADTSYVPLEPLPGLPEGSSVTFTEYMPYAFNLLIGVSFALAFIMIVWGGVEYMSTDAVYGKSEGKQKITNALWGLLLVLGAYIILQTINPCLVNFRIDLITNPGTGGDTCAQPK